MKHQSERLDQQLEEQLRALGIELSAQERAAEIEYLLALLEVNERINLTRITEPSTALRLHVVDSLAALPELRTAPNGAVVDMGSGGGFPGVPLAIATGRPFTLLDSVAKKGAAVGDVLRGLSCWLPTAHIVSQRAEELALLHRGEFAAVVVRAMASLPSLVELASPLLGKGGLLIALKGRPNSAERESGSEVAALVGMSECGWRELGLPGGGELRTIATYAKDGISRVSVPRRTGLAQNTPLA